MSPSEPGSLFHAEIEEQPAALERLLEHDAEIARIARAARERGSTLVRMVGHGSSDNAASYGVYAFGLLPRWTAMRDSITLTVHYDTPLDLSGSTVIGLSQSGRTPDVVEYVTPGPPERRVHDRDHERPRLRAGGRRRGDDPARGRARSSPSLRRRPTSTRSRRWLCSPAISPARERRSPTASAALPAAPVRLAPRVRAGGGRRWRSRSRTRAGCS